MAGWLENRCGARTAERDGPTITEWELPIPNIANNVGCVARSILTTVDSVVTLSRKRMVDVMFMRAIPKVV